MQVDGNNFSNNKKDISYPTTDTMTPLSYKKSEKLITALFMVTDIISDKESIRISIRKTGLDILKDINSLIQITSNTYIRLLKNTNSILSFIRIAKDIKLISSMNYEILNKEFILFRKAIYEGLDNNNLLNNPILSELFNKEEESKKKVFEVVQGYPIGHKGQEEANSIGHNSANIGIQKGDTLLKALKGINIKDKNTIKKRSSSNNNSNLYGKNKAILKNNRSDEILHILKDKKEGLTISEIKVHIKGQLSKASEKTLQRELVTLVKKNVLNKVGSKRWSRYILINNKLKK